MANIIDAAAFILNQLGDMTTMKLQKLVYYSQAQHLVTYGEPLFEEDFQAWRNGPVNVGLYREHRKKFIIRPGELSSKTPERNLTVAESNTILAVCAVLGSETGNALSVRTHREAPWVDARGDADPADMCRTIIGKQVMRDYYSRPEHRIV